MHQEKKIGNGHIFAAKIKNLLAHGIKDLVIQGEYVLYSVNYLESYYVNLSRKSY